MLIRPKHPLFCLILILISTLQVHSLSHFQQTVSPEDQQLQKLTSQQKSLQDKINALLSDITTVQKNVSQTPNASDKVILLEKAILSERQKVFNIQNQLIPPFSLSKTACLQLTNQQKIDMLDKIKATKDELTALQKQILTAPKCDKITGLEKDTQKQITLLETLQKTIYTECQSKSILTPTIYQTNIYADGWILGEQDIDDLIEEYYQRNIRYHNITNCPLETPFFNGQQCIVCKDPEPVFNILTRECTHCSEDQEADSTLRQCAWKPHYTNFSSVQNWAQDGAAMPVPARQLVPCPADKPYYNGKKCEVCLMPKYWSIKTNTCVQCPFGTVFDVNDRKCEKPQTNDLTILQGTRWVTNDCNLTRIIAQRVKVLKLNETQKTYTLCPPEKPFYDGIVCINCPNEFNVDTRKCVQSPNKATAYNENMRCYVQKQTGFETDPRASKYTTKSPLKDSTIINCKQAAPYYDGIACINCLEPFPIFDVDTRRCTVCDPMEVYNNDEHKCIPRTKIYVSTNENKLMATPKMSIDDYQAEIARKIKDNPDAVVLLCQNTEYSDYKTCLNCTNNQYFNVETKQCQLCDGTINVKTKICAEKAYLYTNLNDQSVKRIVAVPTTIQAQNQTINDNIKLHPNAKLCLATQPYFDGTSCTNCTAQSFNMTSKTCVPMVCADPLLPFFNKTSGSCQQCPKDQRYSNKTLTCLPIAYVTNTNAMFFYIEEGSSTKNNLDDKIYEMEAKNVVITCDASHPYWNSTACIDCAISRDTTNVSQLKPYFNLRTLTCVGCKNWDNVTKKCSDTQASPKCVQPTPYLDPATNSCAACKSGTVFNPTTAKCEPCPQGQFYNTKTLKCESCPQGQTYNLATKTCQTCSQGQIFNTKTLKCETWVTNVTAMTNNYMEEGNGTKANLNAAVEKIKSQPNVMVCPAETPFFSNTEGKCIKCADPTPYWNILRETCMKCDKYNADTHQCEEALPRFDMNVEDFYGTIFGG